MATLKRGLAQPSPAAHRPAGSRAESSRRPKQGRRLTLALLLSLIMHTLLIGLTLGGQGAGRPGFAFPWQERRGAAPDLRIVLVPARVAAVEPVAPSSDEPAPPATLGPTAASSDTPTSSVLPAPQPASLAEGPALPKPLLQPQAVAPAGPEPERVSPAAPAQALLRSDLSSGAAPAPLADLVSLARERPAQATLDVRTAVPVPAVVISAAPAASSPMTEQPVPRNIAEAAQERIDVEAKVRAAERARIDLLEREAQRLALLQAAARVESARQEAERLETARQSVQRAEAARLLADRQEADRQDAQRGENARLAAERLETARRAAAQQEAVRQEAERQETTRQAALGAEAQRLAAERQAAARQAAVQQEAARQEAERQETARQAALKAEAQRLAAERQEAARQEAARVEAVRQAAARQEAARLEAEQEQTARREAARRAMGRQLDEEAARRDAAAAAAASQASRLPPSASGVRRGRLFGRADANAELVLYAEAWARKIQLNMTFDMVREAAKRPHSQPLVTVAVRSDGSLEAVTIVRSSGVAEIDEAIKRIVQSQVPFQAFSPALASEFDVVEIRRTWHFDSAIRLY